MGNYRYLALKKAITANELLEALKSVNDIWFSRCLKIELNSEQDHIFWLHNQDFGWSFQIWLSKCGTKITYHPNVKPIDVSIIEEFVARELKRKLGGELLYDE